MANWKTTVFGILVFVLQGGQQFFPKYAPVLGAAQAFAIALLGFFAKDSNVTGGTVKQ